MEFEGIRLEMTVATELMLAVILVTSAGSVAFTPVAEELPLASRVWFRTADVNSPLAIEEEAKVVLNHLPVVEAVFAPPVPVCIVVEVPIGPVRSVVLVEFRDKREVYLEEEVTSPSFVPVE